MGREINPTRRVFADQNPHAGSSTPTMINLSRKLPLEREPAVHIQHMPGDERGVSHNIEAGQDVQPCCDRVELPSGSFLDKLIMNGWSVPR